MLFLFLCALSNVRAESKSAPTLEVSFPNYSYPAPALSLRGVDFKNRLTLVFSTKGTSDLRAHLRRGIYERRTGIDWVSLKLNWIRFVRNSTSEPDYAIAYYIWGAGAVSSSAFGVVQLLDIDEGHLKVVQQILFNLRGSEAAGAFFDAKSNALTIRGVNDWEHCCPTGLDVVQFRLKEGKLKQVSYGKAPLQ